VIIAKCEVILVSYRYRPEEVWGWPGGEYRGWTTAFLRVASDDGCEGIGEIGDGLNFPEAMQPIVERLARVVVGRPARPRGIVAALERSAPGWGSGGLVSSVISGIEIAVVDLLGRQLGVPGHVVLGGAYRDELPAYASGGLSTDPRDLQRELSRHVQAGYRAVKMRIGHGFDLDVRRVEAAREAVGADVQLMLDFGASYLPEPPSLGYLSRLARRLEPFQPAWLEDPLPRQDVAGHAHLRRETGIPIAAGESERSTDNIRRLLDAEAIDILQTDAVYVGGILRQIEIGQLAGQAGVRLAPHTWGSGPGLMAAALTVACSPAGLIVEVPQVFNPLRELTLAEPLRLVDGKLPVSQVPGLGVVLPEDLRSWGYDPQAVPTLHAAAPSAGGEHHAAPDEEAVPESRD
jgi:L-alanine-DL-glutamate epimerase-like enolase superfamily enzyme